jgi:hypothetical protein
MSGNERKGTDGNKAQRHQPSAICKEIMKKERNAKPENHKLKTTNFKHGIYY